MPFVFAACRPGSEVLLKREVARIRPELRLAFSRPGFVTFKAPDGNGPDGLSPAALPLTFARVHGLSLGRAGTAAVPGDDLPAAVVEATRRLMPDRRVCLQVFPREAEDPREDAPVSDVAPVDAAIRAAPGAAVTFLDRTVAQPGDVVLDVIVSDPGEWWVGAHRHAPGICPHPGGRPPLVLPVEAPSRAWLKLEEALLFTGAILRPGESAVEVGSAPGGASWALLNRGVSVWGIDPAVMDPRVLSFCGPSRFVHLHRSIASVYRRDLPRVVDWLFIDVNEGPGVTLPMVEKLVPDLSPGLRGVFLTVKANKPDVADRVPALRERFVRLGLRDVLAAQLSFHHREFLLAGATR